ncbi:hypothetical protein Flav3CDRAFT_0932 [Flavobacteria bacterium MS024-3C]|nr:hypothetical protein Flav3CDRAFT_0932 [Flavobacteria bacterium MS024-3C]
MVLVIKIVSKKSLGVKLKFDISNELSTKKNKKAPIRVLSFLKPLRRAIIQILQL